MKPFATFIGSMLAIGLLLVTLVRGANVIDLELQVLDRTHKHHIDDIEVAILIFSVGVCTDFVLQRHRRREELAAQKLRTLQATMRTVHYIVNNFLNNLLLFEMEARGKVSAAYLDELDELIQATHRKLKALGDVKTVEESLLPSGTVITFAEP